MDEKKQTVSYIVFEGEMTRMERTIHRLWISTILLLLALLGTNAGWLYYESQWEPYTETIQEVTQSAESSEGNAINKFVGGDSYGESDSDNENNN